MRMEKNEFNGFGLYIFGFQFGLQTELIISRKKQHLNKNRTLSATQQIQSVFIVKSSSKSYYNNTTDQKGSPSGLNCTFIKIGKELLIRVETIKLFNK